MAGIKEIFVLCFAGLRINDRSIQLQLWGQKHEDTCSNPATAQLFSDW